MNEYRIQYGAECHEMTAEEIAKMKADILEADRKHWLTVDYDEAVVAEIRKRYSLSQELAIQRQRYEKPDEFAQYFAYCEECKAFVKSKKAEYV